jgi:Flp pilus assembly protein TadD
MNKLVMCFIVCGTCSAQTPTMSAEQIQMRLLHDMKGDAAVTLNPQSHSPHSFFASFELEAPPPQVRPPGDSISVKRLQHKVPKEALQSAARAQKFSRAGEYSRAVVELEAAIRRDPEFVPAQNALGIEYRRCGRLEEAVAAFGRLTHLAPEEWAGHYNLAVTLFQSGDFPGALQSGRRAVQIAPTRPTANLFLGYLLILRKETQKEAVPYLQYAARSRPEARSILRRFSENGDNAGTSRVHVSSQ